MPPRLSEALAGRYRIERQLGVGAMATVFLAHDLKHDRDVALKVLKPDLAKSLTGERFLREIAITARLNHPHILTLLDSGETADGEYLYYVMPVATGESLRDHLGREGAFSIDEAVRLAIDVAEALAHAHAQGVVHRDIKPDNVVLSGGHAIVLDFGIAKALGHARESMTLTMEGTSIGTPVYMAPEQATGDGDVDHRADIYAVGAMLYEMLTGVPPFAGPLHKIVADKVTTEAPSVSAKCAEAPSSLVKVVARCMSRDPAGRPQTAEALVAELRAVSGAASAGERVRSRTAIWIGAAALVALGVVSLVLVRDRRARWVHETAMPNIARLAEADQLDSAFLLAESAAARAPNDTALLTMWDGLAQKQSFESDPAGAEVTRASVDDTTKWTPVGTTPTGNVRIPNNAWFYRYTKPGYRTVTVMGARLWGSYVPIPLPVPLRRLSDPDTDMVQIRGGRLVGTLYGLMATDTFRLADFMMDRLEVTNRQYRAFVNAGGYTKRDFWDSTIVRDGKRIAWEAAMAAFTDKTGRPGPASWEGGAPAPDADDMPVGGVSWYEARAYARFVKKELPTVYEWNAAAIPEAARWVVPWGRYEASGPVRGGAARGVGPRGVYDMAGNVREWTTNAKQPGNRYILGGGWSDPTYLFSEIYTQDEFDRSPINGIRLIRRLGEGKDLAKASAPIPGLTRDFKKVRPVDDATFRGYLAMYDYDRAPLNAKVEMHDTTSADWVREYVSYDGVAGGARMDAVLFLPKHAKAPYQTVVIWPGSSVFFLRGREKVPVLFVDYIVRSGRAVLFPIYEHTLGRGTGQEADVVSATITHRDQTLRWAKELRRSLDYLTTRQEIDTTRFAYVGTSWGGRVAAVMLAVEPRFRTAVLNVAGISMNPVRPEEDAVNFLPRVRVPVLMLSGKYDSVFPYEVSQKPFYDLLGTPTASKQLKSFDGGHFLPRTMMVSETLGWLDQYLGKVGR
jgi:dienelactone hydrolase